MNSLNALDVWLLQVIHLSGQSYPWLAKFAIATAGRLIYLLPLHLVFMWVVGNIEVRRQAMAIFLGVAVALFCSYLIGLVYIRPRPFVEGIVPLLVDHKPTPSFPSNHALIFAVYAYCLWKFGSRFMLGIALSFAIITFWARVYTGLHYLFDILGGIVIGCIIAWFTINYWIKYIPNWILKLFLLNQK